MRRAPRPHRLRNWRAATAAACIPLLLCTGLAPAEAAGDDGLRTYIVEGSASAISTALGTVPDARAEVLEHTGTALARLTSAEAATLGGTPGVTLAADARAAITDADDGATGDADRTGHDRTATAADSEPARAGEGVRIYILDTGTSADRAEFGSRVVDGYDAIRRAAGPTGDCNGHGTAVASAAAGAESGVATRATIVPVRVADCAGSAATSDLIRGLDWIAATHPAGAPGVVNISMDAPDAAGDPASRALGDAVASVVRSGLFVARKAGGNGATEPALGQRAGANFATPLVSGLAAVHLANRPADTPAATTEALRESVRSAETVDGEPVDGAPVDVAPGDVAVMSASVLPPVPPAVQGLTLTRIAATGTTGPRARHTWTASSVTGSAAVTDYLIQVSANGSAWTTYTDPVSTVPAYTSPALAQNSSYVFRVIAKNISGNGPAATSAAMTVGRERPAAVTGLTATRVPATSTSGPRITLAWAAPTDAGFTAVRDYVIQVSANGGAWTTYADGASISRSFTTPALTANSSYAFRVAAANTFGPGPASATPVMTTRIQPGAVTGLKATLVPATTTTGPRVTLSWAAPADPGFTPIRDYVIQVSMSGGAWSTYADGTNVNRTFTTPALAASSSYAFRVTPVNSYGAGLVAGTTFTTSRERPSAVTALTAKLVPATTTVGPRVTLAWSLPTDPGFTPISDYIIQVSKNAGAWATYADGTTINRTFTTPALSASSSYAFRVTAVNSYGVGTGASATYTTSRDTPSAVTALTTTLVPATTTTGPSRILTWSAPVDPGFTAVSDYMIQVSVNGGGWTTYTDPIGPDRTFTTPALAGSSTYVFRVTARNSYGWGLGADATAATSSAKPGTPRMLKATGATTTGALVITVAWVSPADPGFTPIGDYLVQYSRDGGPWTTFVRPRSPATSFTTPALPPAKYAFRVYARNAWGTGPAATLAAAAFGGKPGPTFGIDIATAQKDIDLGAAKADEAQFVIVKTGGLNVTPQYVSPFYTVQIDRAITAGLPRGHYYVPGRGQTPQQQADYFVDHLYRFDKNHDVLALDNEVLDANGIFWHQDEVAQFITQVRLRTGIAASHVWVYAGAQPSTGGWRNGGPWDKLEALGIRYWWAAYGDSPIGHVPDHEPDLQGSIPRWDVHQFTSNVGGVGLDGDYSRLSILELFGVEG